MNKVELNELLKENKRLKDDNEMLLNVVAQMRVTLNRLVKRFITEQPDD